MFPSEKPSGLRTSPAGPVWWRIDHTHPSGWDWEGFGTARHRFDPPSGRFRVRYASNSPQAAACERFSPHRIITRSNRQLWLVRLADPARTALHLTHQQNLTALGIDDRISTGRLHGQPAHGDSLLRTSQELSAAVHVWWDGNPPPLVYRTRSIPQQRSMAFTERLGWRRVDAMPLRDATRLLADLIRHHQFTIPDDWLT